MYLNVLQGYLRHILSALKHPWQASHNIFQVSTLTPSTVSHAHHSPLTHGRSSLLTWFLSLSLAPAADLPSPWLDQIQEMVLRAGSLDGVKSLSLLLSATKVGRWQVGEKTIQVDFPSGNASCQIGRAPRYRRGTGGIGTTAYSCFWRFRNHSLMCRGSDQATNFFFFFSQQQAYNKGNEKNCMKDPVSNLPVYHGLPKNLTKHMCNSNQTVPFCIWNKLVKYLTQFQRDIAPNWKATLELSVQRRQLGHQCKDLDSHFHDLCVLMNLTNCGQPHLGSASIHSLHLGLGASCKPRLTLHAWTMAQKYLRPCVFAGLDSLAVLPTSASNATHHPALAWFCKLICQWKVLLSTTQSTALWYSWTLVTGSAHP